MSARQLSTAFIYPAEESESGASSAAQFEKDAADFEKAGRIMEWVHKGIMAPAQGGGAPSARVIAIRWVILRLLLGIGTERSLRSYALDLGISRSCLSQAGLRMAERLGVRGSWQRFGSREIYRARALAVHAGKHKASDRWERRQLREAKREQEKLTGSFVGD